MVCILYLCPDSNATLPRKQVNVRFCIEFCPISSVDEMSVFLLRVDGWHCCKIVVCLDDLILSALVGYYMYLSVYVYAVLAIYYGCLSL